MANSIVPNNEEREIIDEATRVVFTSSVFESDTIDVAMDSDGDITFYVQERDTGRAITVWFDQDDARKIAEHIMKITSPAQAG